MTIELLLQRSVNDGVCVCMYAYHCYVFYYYNNTR